LGCFGLGGGTGVAQKGSGGGRRTKRVGRASEGLRGRIRGTNELTEERGVEWRTHFEKGLRSTGERC